MNPVFHNTVINMEHDSVWVSSWLLESSVICVSVPANSFLHSPPYTPRKKISLSDWTFCSIHLKTHSCKRTLLNIEHQNISRSTVSFWLSDLIGDSVLFWRTYLCQFHLLHWWFFIKIKNNVYSCGCWACSKNAVGKTLSQFPECVTAHLFHR